MELIFGEGCDGDTQATIFAALADGGYHVTIRCRGVEFELEVEQVSNANFGEISGRVVDDEGTPVGNLLTFGIEDITEMEIH